MKFQGSGIAAVVGPNGCGKSNLSDAITWVLGEQSARSLRGARMEDVIFAGTRNRKPVGMASVTMVLVDPVVDAPAADSPNGPEPPESESSPAPNNVTVLPAKPSEVTITRRLFRSGESEYLIDGRQARLRDIQDIFMGSGLGPESYAIIEQGRIGQILSSKPSDRRGVIEEAAGITRYKSRKRLAESKLESAKQNLARVFDILDEVTRQVNSLKRQAAKAKRYSELKADLDIRLRTLLGARFHVLDAEARDAALALEEASAALRQLMEQVSRGEQDRSALQDVCCGLERELTGQRKRLAEANVESERTRGRLEAQVRESGALEQRMARGEEETKELDGRLAVSRSERDGLAVTVREMESQITASRSQMIEKNQVRDQLQNLLREHEKTIEGNRAVVLRLLGEANTLKNQLAQADEFLVGIDRETARVGREEENASAEIVRLTEARSELSETLSGRQMDLETVTGEKRQTEETLGARRGLAAQSRAQLDQLRSECSRLKAKKESLENVISHHSYTTDSVKRLFNAADRGTVNGFKPLGVLADFVEVDPTFERAAEEFLRDQLEYVVVESWEQAERGMQIFHPAAGEALEGRATFLVEQGIPTAWPAPENAPDLPRLADHLRLTNGLTQQASALLPRLTNCYLASGPDQAREQAALHPDFYFLLANGQCYHGRMLSGGHKKASGPLALKRELREVTKSVTEQDRLLAESIGTFERLTEEISRLEHDLERLRMLQQTREKDALALGHEMRKLTEEHNRANSRISVARLDLDRLNRERARALEQRERNHAAAARKDEERAVRELSLESAREQLDLASADAARVREEHSALRAGLAALEERHRAASATLQRLEAQIRDMASRRSNLSEDIERMGEHRARILSENIELDEKAGTLAELTLETESAVLILADREASRRTELQAAEEWLKGLRSQIEASHQRRTEIEVELVRRQSELKFLEETSRKELGMGLADLEHADLSVPVDLAEVERGYNDVRQKIESLGPINPQALEEFEEAQVRQDFLTAQRQDLLDSIRDTEKAIHEIDQISRSRFQEAFDAINENFKQAFQTLFGGGSGEMRLTDESNASESGIDIIASPPGKKLQNVLLLSGGEKSMAAMALLMAIFKFQPSPFCVLDEVDAPLDEANIGRLSKLLKEMSLDTQFIIITHSKKTMEAAQSMYGVTMQEAGISKLVSVRMNSSEMSHPAVA
ncbi:MAG: chromosome segregation protein SMC [Acidobacteriota bacterium]|nr:chromosome segregation protein SMC [Acidobacteriota bacterium]